VVNNITGGTTTVSNTTLLDTGNDTGGNITATNATVDIQGQVTGGNITANNSTIDIAGQATGAAVTLNSSALVVGSTTGGTVTYGTGVSSVAIASLTSGTPQLAQLYNNDSIAVTNVVTSATLNASDTTLTLKNGAATVATFNVSLAPGAATAFEPITTEVINGTTYYVATLDPPPGDPLTAPINQNNVLGSIGHGNFLQGTTLPKDGAPAPVSGGNLAGPEQGDHLGSTPTLPSGQLLADLTNIGKLDGLGRGSNDPGSGSGHPTTPNVTGVGGLGNLDMGGKPEFKDLMSHNHNMLPKH